MASDSTPVPEPVPRQTLSKLIEIVSKSIALDQNQIEKITPETSIVRDLNADSLDVVEALMEVSEHYEFEVDGEAAKNMENIGDLARYIVSHQKYNSNNDTKPYSPLRNRGNNK